MRSQVGHYEVVCELGRGGMGVVYKGFESALNRYVAIKTLSESLSHDESVKERFLREARSMAQLNDAHIIQIYFIGEDQSQPFFAMEFVEGESLSSFLKREVKLTPEQAAKVIVQTASGLAVAHDKGVVHRDIKPANLMLTTRGNIKIADFGIALAQHDFSKKLTATGEFVGTPGYLSPEVCLGKVVDLRSDIFSLGIVFFEMLTGRMPFTDESPLGLLLEVVRAEIPDVRALNGEVDPEIARILTKMVAKEPENRYQDCHQLIEDLQRHPLVAKGGPITAKAKIPTAAATVVAGMKTPVEAMAAMPSARPSPVPASRPTPMTNPPLPEPPPPASVRPSVLDRPQKSSSAWIWPVAAILVLGLLGGGAFGVKLVWDRFQEAQLAATGNTGSNGLLTGLTDAGNENADTTANNGTVGDEPGTETDPSAETGANDGMLKPSDIIADGKTMAGNSVAAEAGSEPPDGTDTAHTGYAGAAEDDVESDEYDDTAPGIQALAELAEKSEGRREQRIEQAQAAIASGERNIPPRAAAAALRAAAMPPVANVPPRILVIGLGDRGLALAAEKALEDALNERGFLVADEELIDGVDRIIESGRPDIPRLLGILARENGVRAVTIIRAEELGSTPLTYYGQTDTLYSANLTIKTVDVRTKQPVGPQLSQKVDFTNLTANEKAEEAVAEGIDRYVAAMAAYRPTGSGG
ncbi:hypothetical protein C7S18_12895 [Ahniella affigens]|uniref:non-specific serine/threonine protein kinase n=1 Tax=Ahniella affigens TaxID=2021234 RepID=A0A2P1PT83_9GAMM|nr:serine/threonine-protein kinase [Ahniella affigens]AVP98041.1 hypothetical protein C7S18_12895 [Ahniella affigens]